MDDAADRRTRWLDAWLHTDLVGIPVALALVLIVGVCVALYLVLGDVGGLVVGKLLFALALGALFGGILLLNGRPGETTAGLAHAPLGGPRRVLVIANEALASESLCDEVRGRAANMPAEALIIAPVVASSPLHLLTDDVDAELRAARERLDDAVARLRRAGTRTSGQIDIGAPMQSLLDGMREFSPSEVLMLRGHERGWPEAECFAEHVTTDLGIPVLELEHAAA